MSTVEIELNKTRLVLLFFSSLGFVAIGFWLVFSPLALQDLFFGSTALLATIGAIAILFFGLAAFLIGRKIADSGPGLLINSEGITDTSSGTSIGFIAWKDITSISSKVINTQTFLIISVDNPQDYINRATREIKKKLYQSTYKTHGTPIIISAAALSIKAPELIKLLQDYLRMHKELDQTHPN